MIVTRIVLGFAFSFSTYLPGVNKAVRRSILSVGLCLTLALLAGYAPVLHAQSISFSTLTLPQIANDIVWDETRSRFFASSGTNVLMINPETAKVEDTIPTGNLANQIAVSSDGQYLYVALDKFLQT